MAPTLLPGTIRTEQEEALFKWYCADLLAAFDDLAEDRLNDNAVVDHGLLSTAKVVIALQHERSQMAFSLAELLFLAVTFQNSMPLYVVATRDDSDGASSLEFLRMYFGRGIELNLYSAVNLHIEACLELFERVIKQARSATIALLTAIGQYIEAEPADSVAFFSERGITIVNDSSSDLAHGSSE